MVKLVEAGEDVMLDCRAVQTGFFDGWQSQLSSVVRAAFGAHDADAPTGTSCGIATLTSCRALLRSSLTKITAVLQSSLGNDSATWRKPVLCPNDPMPTRDENRPLTA